MVATGVGKVKEIFTFSRSGKSQGILYLVLGKFEIHGLSQRKVREFISFLFYLFFECDITFYIKTILILYFYLLKLP